jgi:putative tricarboxylic transport membrane protein
MWRAVAPAAAGALLATSALAQVDLKVTVPAAPGSGWDQTAHAIEEALLDSGAARSVAVANVPGGRGAAGFSQFVRAEPEPSRIIVIGFPMLGALLRGNSGVSLSDAVPLARLTADYLAVAVPAESPIASARDLAEAVRTDPAKVTWGGGQPGSIDHVLAALFTKAAGADPGRMAYAPFFGAVEMLDAAAAGQVTAVVASPRQLEEPVKAGRLKVVGVTAPIRLDELDAPTLKEQGIDLVLANWRAVMAPAGLRPEAFAALAAAVDAMVRSPAWEDVLRRKDWHNAYLPPERFAAFLDAERARVAEALRSVGLAK